MKLNKRGKRNLTILGIAIYIFLLSNAGAIMDNILEGSTIFCYQNNVQAWWMNR